MVKSKLIAGAVSVACVAVGLWFLVLREETPAPARYAGYTGSQSCRECHEKFYQLWAPSHHGLAMQLYTAEFAGKELSAQREDIVIGTFRYRAEIEPDKGRVLERGAEGDNTYPVKYVMGGKNVYYFLTLMDRGRLQTLPLAYDVRAKEWFDTAASGMRHVTDEPVSWKESVYTFNTACYRCHVSQLSLNYDVGTDTYRTTWAEPGINCETCHGPAEEHIRVCKEAPKGTVPRDLKIERGGRDFSVEQNNAACAPCHAQVIPLTTTFKPGERFFDHYDLTTLEDVDFYPDGRDLGENYTYTLWLLSPCAKSGQLSCLHCHTSSGRYRQKKEPNTSCMPCHEERVRNVAAHSHHPAGSDGSTCVGCHMPMTEFARMRRSDHSMLPPTPAATIALSSPNACNLCHIDKDAVWADAQVRQWHQKDYQAPVLYRAGLIAAARERDWSRLSEMLQYVTSTDRDEVYAASLIRLLRACPETAKWTAILEAMKDSSPLVRAAASESLSSMPSRETAGALIKATGDEYRVVRIRAAGALAGYPASLVQLHAEEQERATLDGATEEFVSFLMSRPDHWTSHYNVGNYHMNKGDLSMALASYDIALKLEPRAVMAMVNASLAHARMGKNDKAEELLRRAFDVEPNNAAAHFNMGLLKAEQKDLTSAERHLRAALASDRKMHEAAYNLGVLVTADRPKEGLELVMKAYELNPTPRYGYTLAYYMRKQNDLDGAAKMLHVITEKWPGYGDAYLLLGDTYTKQGRVEEAVHVYRKALAEEHLSPTDRIRVEAELRELEPSPGTEK